MAQPTSYALATSFQICRYSISSLGRVSKGANGTHLKGCWSKPTFRLMRTTTFAAWSSKTARDVRYPSWKRTTTSAFTATTRTGRFRAMPSPMVRARGGGTRRPTLTRTACAPATFSFRTTATSPPRSSIRTATGPAIPSRMCRAAWHGLTGRSSTMPPARADPTS